MAPSFGSARGLRALRLRGRDDPARPPHRFVGTGLAWLAHQKGEQPFAAAAAPLRSTPQLRRAPAVSRSLQRRDRVELHAARREGARRCASDAATLAEPERRFVRAAYDEEIASVDAQLGIFLDALEKRGFLTAFARRADRRPRRGALRPRRLRARPRALAGAAARAARVLGRRRAARSRADAGLAGGSHTDAARRDRARAARRIPTASRCGRISRAAPRSRIATAVCGGPALRPGAQGGDPLAGQARAGRPPRGEWRHFDLERDPGETQPDPVAARPELETPATQRVRALADRQAGPVRARRPPSTTRRATRCGVSATSSRTWRRILRAFDSGKIDARVDTRGPMPPRRGRSIPTG